MPPSNFLLTLIPLASSLALGLTVSPEALERQLSGADRRVQLEVHSRESYLAEAGVIHTRSLSRIINGGGSEWITLDTIGGEIDGVGQMVPGFARPYVGAVYDAYLKQLPDGTFTPVGFEQGFRQISRGKRNSSRNRTDGSNGEGTGPYLFWDFSFLPIPYYLSAASFSGHPDYPAAIDASFRTWAAPGDTVLDFSSIGCSSITRNENDGINNIILIRDNWPFSTDAIAITRNFYVSGTTAQGGLILDSDILLNGVNHSFTTTGEAGKHDVQNILTHEIGHFLGLGHETTPKDADAVMYEVASTNETKKRTLGNNDLSIIRSAYSGVGKKVGQIGNVCEIPDGNNTGCLSTRGNNGDWINSIFPFGLLVLSWWWGRRRATARLL